MFDKLKKKREEKKKKKKANAPEMMKSLKANGVEIEVINFSLNRAPDGTPMLEVRTRDVCEALHYEHVSFQLETSLKRIDVGGKFKEATSEKRFKVYFFEVDDYNQYYI